MQKQKRQTRLPPALASAFGSGGPENGGRRKQTTPAGRWLADLRTMLDVPGIDCQWAVGIITAYGISKTQVRTKGGRGSKGSRNQKKTTPKKSQPGKKRPTDCLLYSVFLGVSRQGEFQKQRFFSKKGQVEMFYQAVMKRKLTKFQLFSRDFLP
jgi:hypothetical protein